MQRDAMNMDGTSGGGAVLTATVLIRNVKGLHARASAKFVKCAERFDADVRVVREDMDVDATSIMGLMMLAASPGTILTLSASGPDAAAALKALSDLVACGFDEECVEDSD
ncbi:MAG: HPr family phosphocarrier protein [Pseudomonadota bacterium]